MYLSDRTLEVRPETRPRHLGARWSECARAAEHRCTRISNAYARSAEGPGKGAPTQWGCNGPHGRRRSGRTFRPHLRVQLRASQARHAAIATAAPTPSAVRTTPPASGAA